MMLHGGQFHVYYSRSKTTHIIANNLPNSKIQELKGEKIMKPEWITDRCVKLSICSFHMQAGLFVKSVLHNISLHSLCLYCCLFEQYQGWASSASPTVPAIH